MSNIIPNTSLVDIQAALQFIDPNIPRDDWVCVGMAMHAELGEAGFDLFDSWSSGGQSYKPADTKSTWKSFDSSGGVTIATMFNMAQENGYRRKSNGSGYTPAPRPVKLPVDPAEAASKARAARDKAQALWAKGMACKTHPYTTDKGIDPIECRRHRQNLLIPMYNEEWELSSVQTIKPNGKKRFLKDCPVSGLYYIIGKPANKTVIVAEGYSTAVSIHMATDICVVIAFSKGNMPKVAKIVREKRPDFEIILAPDNDSSGDAVKMAEKAALKHECKVIYPKFPEGVAGTDWNDLHSAEGPEEVCRQIYNQALDSWPPPIHLKETSNPFTDASNAHRFVRQFSRNTLNIDGIGWHRWSGSRWFYDEHYTDRCAQEIGRLIRKESIRNAKAANDIKLSEDKRHTAHTKAKALLKWAKSSESHYRITATKKLAEAHLSFKAEHFDVGPLLLNCPNGTVDVRTGKLRPARRSDLITKSTGVPYDPQASYELWEKTVLDICCGDVELMRYLQRVIGYCLTGLTTEQVMFIFNGGGSNGKDTFLGRVKKAMGDYAGLAAPNLLLESRSDRHPTEIADLQGVRIAIASESSDNHRLHETRVKHLTGSEFQKARRMRQDFFEFPTQFKLVLMTNHRPIIEGDDYAMWRRLHLVPFNQTYKKGVNRDDGLSDRLDQHLAGILRWCVEGCMDWQEKGLQPPDVVKNATAQYRAEQDVFQQFIDDECVIQKPAQVTAKAFHEAYDNWCRENGEHAKSTNWVWPKLQERGVTKKRSSMCVVYYGIGLFHAKEE